MAALLADAWDVISLMHKIDHSNFKEVLGSRLNCGDGCSFSSKSVPKPRWKSSSPAMMHLETEPIYLPPYAPPDQHTPVYLFKEAINVKEKISQVPRTSDSGLS